MRSKPIPIWIPLLRMSEMYARGYLVLSKPIPIWIPLLSSKGGEGAIRFDRVKTHTDMDTSFELLHRQRSEKLNYVKTHTDMDTSFEVMTFRRI